MIEEVYRHLRSIEEFRNLSLHDIQIEPLQTLAHSEVYRVQIATPPASLILKKSGAYDSAGLADRERRFYRHIAPLLPSWLVPACRLVVDGESTGKLFIEDLSASHHSVDAEPTRLECQSLVKALAALHGITSADSTILKTWTRVGAGLPAESLEQRLSFFQLALRPFIEMIRERINPQVEGLLTGLGDLDERIKSMGSRQNTLIHGDAHFANALFFGPHACLIDWAMPMIAFGEIDLAHALALNLPRDLRREWEEEMIGVHIDQVSAWSSPVERAAFDERYRIGVLYSLVSPIVWWRSGVPESQWWAALNNSLDASRDLGLIS